MALITSIATQKKEPNRYNVFVDGTFKIGITQETLLKFHLHKGMVYTDELDAQITAHVFYMRLYQKALNYLSYALRSEHDVRQTLCKILPEPTDAQLALVETIIAQLKNERYINDEQYVTAYIQNNFATTKKGPFAIKQALQKKGIALPLIEQALAAMDHTTAYNTAIAVAQKYADKQKQLSQKAIYDKTRIYLAQRGYAFSMIDTVLQQIDVSQSAEQEDAALQHHLEKITRRYTKKYRGYDLKNKLFQALHQKGFDTYAIKSAISNYLEENHLD